MVGDSECMLHIRRQIARIAKSDATVLIEGESGTGKELVASAIHAQSARADLPMLCLNCAALSGNLLESELFGHERGAFTGADRLRKGRFELADGGTLLLDEISEMALPLQAKLLRVLQEGEFERVGSSCTRRANVRVLATTNRNLEEWVAKKRFRGDLYFRLNVLPVHLPPLRHRGDDLRSLVDHFLADAASRSGRTPLTVSDDAYRMMQDYTWPGNVRELENLCQRAAVLVTGGVLTSDVIRGWLQPDATAATPFANLRPGCMLEDMERWLIEKVLEENNGHRQRSAKVLGMGVRTLGLKLKQWREEAEAERASAQRSAPSAPAMASV
jgi:transcriptional regulator with GAF, ATPase, and Fis domain